MNMGTDIESPKQWKSHNQLLGNKHKLWIMVFGHIDLMAYRNIIFIISKLFFL